MPKYDSDLLQLLGFISQAENQKRHKKEDRRAKYRKAHPEKFVKTSSSGSSSGGASRSNATTHKEKKKDDSFWDNVKDATAPLGEGLFWTLDKMARFNYGASGAVKEFQKAEAKDEKSKGSELNFFEKLASQAETLDEAVTGYKRGFKGKTKTTLADNLKWARKHDKSQTGVQKFVTGNPWARGITGFALDVALDPTTFLGVGVVTKPLAARKAIIAGNADKKLAKDLEGLGVTAPAVRDTGEHYEKAITADEYLDMMGKLDHRRVVKGKTRRERAAYRKRNTLKGRNAYANAADETRRLRNRLDLTATVKTKIQNLDPRKHSHSVLMHAAYQSRMQQVLDEAIDNTGKVSLRNVINNLDAKQQARAISDGLSGAAPPVGKTQIGGELSEMVDDAWQVAGLTKLVKSHSMYMGAQKKLVEHAGKVDHPEYVRALSNIEKAKEDMRKVTDDWTFGDKDAGYGEVSGALDAMLKFAEDDLTAKGLRQQTGKLGRDIKEHTKKGEGQAAANKIARRKADFARLDRRKARILLGVLGHKASGQSYEDILTPEMGSSLKEIDARISAIEDKLSHGEIQTAGGVDVTAVSARETAEAGPHTIESELTDVASSTPRELRRELKDKKAERNQLLLKAMDENTPNQRVEPPDEIMERMQAGASTADILRAVESGEITGEWADLLKTNIEERAIDARQPKLETKIRNRRAVLQKGLSDEYDIRDLPPKLQSMFHKPEGAKAAVFKIADADGNDVLLTDGKKLDELATPEDSTQAARINAQRAEDEAYEKIMGIKKKPAEEYIDVERGGPENFEKDFQRRFGISVETAKQIEHAITIAGETGAMYVGPKLPKGVMIAQVRKALKEESEGFRPKSGTKRAKGNVGHGTNPESVVKPVTKSTREITFRRIFQEQHKTSPEGARAMLQKETGDYVTAGPKGRVIPKIFFVDHIRQFPEDLGPTGANVTIHVADKQGRLNPVTYADFKKKHGKPAPNGDYTILPKDKQEQWAGLVRKWIDNTDEATVSAALKKGYQTALGHQRKRRKDNFLNEFSVGIPKHEINKMTEKEMLKKLGEGEFSEHFSTSEMMKMQQDAFDEAIKGLNDEWSGVGDLSLNPAVGDKAYILPRGRDPQAELDELHDTVIDMLDDNYHQAQIKGKIEVDAAVDKMGVNTKVTNELAALHATNEQAKLNMLQAINTARDTQEIMIKRLEEHMLLAGAANAERNGVHALRFSMMGTKMFPDIPAPEMLTKLTAAISNAPIINKATEVWANSFSPASKLSPELNKARQRAMSRTPELIKQHIIELHRTFRKTKAKSRKAAYRSWKATGKATDPVSMKIESEFNALLPYVNGSMKIGDKFLTAYDVNKFLPDDAKMIHPVPNMNINNVRFKTGHDIAKVMSQSGKDVDPHRLLWSLRVATEKAQAQHALDNTVIGTFGIKRDVTKGMDLSDQGRYVEQLHQGHGWVTVAKHLGTDHYFDPQTAKEINRLYEIMKPGKEINSVIGLYDKALHFWKGMVTVYNPGYYTRNGIGEVIMGIFDGLNNPKYYMNASRVMRPRIKASETQQALKALDPMEALRKKPPTTGKRITVAKLKSGYRVSADEAEVLYSYAGLKSGFVSTEYEHVFPREGSLRGTAPGRAATGVNDFVRARGEQYEDYFRMAHFLYRLEDAPRSLSLEEAADYAAGFVRKYHFDYTDFTPHEKALWMRVFPFYKWTRKAMPLMASMLFTQPGKVLLYPKAAQNLAYAKGQDPSEDDNGILPNYEESVPEWMRGLFTYPMGTDQEGNQNYGRIATPAMDVYSQIGNPVAAGLSMLSPIPKNIIEQSTGETMEHGDFQYEMKNGEARFNRLAGMTPLTSLLNKVMEARGLPNGMKQGDPKGTDDPLAEPGPGWDEKIMSYLTGVGSYELNEDTKDYPEKKKKK